MAEKHFKAVAELLRHRRHDPNGTVHEVDIRRETVDAVAADLADYFITINPNFNPRRFLAACRGEPEGRASPQATGRSR